MKDSRLAPHAQLIRELVAKGATNDEVLQVLGENGCPVSLETVRKWVSTGKLRGENQRRGRPPSKPKGVLQILPSALPQNPEKIILPAAFRQFLDPYADNEVSSILARTQLGIPDCEPGTALGDQDLQMYATTLGKARVNSLVDLEFCLISFWCANLPNIPGPADDGLNQWYQRLVFEACRIRNTMRKAVGLSAA